MGENRVRRILQICIGIMLMLTVIPVIPFNESIVENVSAGSSWVQTTEQDFNNGTLTNVTVVSGGGVTLALQMKYVEDDFTDESEISDKNNVLVDTSISEAKLIKHNFTFGGYANDSASSVLQSADGNYIMVGSTESYGAGGRDGWLIKTNSTGYEIWNKTFGGSDNDGFSSIQQTTDGGYIIVGSSSSFTSDFYDPWLMKINSSGIEEWNRTYYGSSGKSVQQTSDGGYIITGAYGGIQIIKTDSLGNEQWNRTFSGIHLMYWGSDGKQTVDGGYVIVGSFQNIFDMSDDAWLIKTNDTGVMEWDKTFGDQWHDAFYSVQLTSDGGYIICGETDSFGIGNLWVVKTNSSGDEELNKTFGGLGYETGCSIQPTNDGGYIISGETSGDMWLIKIDSSGNEQWNQSCGGGDIERGLSAQQTLDGGYVVVGWREYFSHGYNDARLIKTDSTGAVTFTHGDLTSVNLLLGEEVGPISTFNCTTSIHTDTGIKVQFSQDSTIWYNSGGTPNGWDLLSDGFNSIDLSPLDWQGSNFYYRLNFTSDTIDAPRVRYINVSYGQYLFNGTFESQPFDAGAGVNWIDILWSFGVSGSSNIQTQIRTANTSLGLAGKEFTGPDGTNSTYYNVFNPDIHGDHDDDSWVQYIIYFTTTDPTDTVVLFEIIIRYNHFPGAPTLNTPTDGESIDEYNPTFTWVFNDSDGTQGGFQVLVDDDNGFGSVNHDSGQVSSGTQSYTMGSPITADTWYWKVRTKDNDGDWGLYSGIFSFTILSDTTPPNPFIPTADFDSWTSDTQFDILFSTTDADSGIDYYEVSIDNGSFSIQSSPYTLPTQTEGVHNITIRAYDIVGNFVDGYIDIFIDTSPPSITHNPVTDATVGVSINITSVVTDTGSGVQNVYLFYKKSTESTYTQLLMSAMGNDYEAQIPGSAVTSDGLEYYIEVEDSASTPNVAYYSATGQTTTEPTSSNDIDISISAGDVVSPTVTSHSPTGTNVAVDSTISVVFNEAMNETSTEGAFSISPAVIGAFQWSGNALTFTPSTDLGYNTIYNVTIGSGAQDLVGNTLGLYSWEFTTIPGATTGPEVIDWEPKGANVRVDGIEIRIKFSEDMNHATTWNAISIYPSSPEFVPTWFGDDTIILSPRGSLKSDTKYTVNVSTDATSANGDHLEVEHSWYFFTEEGKEEASFWDTWEPIITGITILISLIAFLIGFLTLRKKRSKLRKYMERIDDTFNEYKKNYQECEKELVTLREDIKQEVKDGKIEENHFLILDKKIDDYLREMKALEKGGAAILLSKKKRTGKGEEEEEELDEELEDESGEEPDEPDIEDETSDEDDIEEDITEDMEEKDPTLDSDN